MDDIKPTKRAINAKGLTSNTWVALHLFKLEHGQLLDIFGKPVEHLRMGLFGTLHSWFVIQTVHNCESMRNPGEDLHIAIHLQPHTVFVHSTYNTSVSESNL